jgi:hypothetical protein
VTREEKLVQYLRRSYTTVDGLWFVMIEKDEGQDRALELDERVWRVMGKIQAREAGRLAGRAGNAVADMRDALALKFEAEAFEHAIEESGDGVVFRISNCPWYEILKRAGREHLASVLSERICVNEYQAWAKEYGCQVELERGFCTGRGECVVRISAREIA